VPGGHPAAPSRIPLCYTLSDFQGIQPAFQAVDAGDRRRSVRLPPKPDRPADLANPFTLSLRSGFGKAVTGVNKARELVDVRNCVTKHTCSLREQDFCLAKRDPLARPSGTFFA
jgi:hypothetical protein